MKEVDLELYRYLLGRPEGYSESEISTNAAEGRVSDISINRARVVVAEMGSCG